MATFHLDLRDSNAILSFIDRAVPFLPEKDRKVYLQMEADFQARKRVPPAKVAEIVRNLGAATWAKRRALDRFLSTVGSGFEWDAVLTAVRPTTALLLKRLRASNGEKTLDEALKSSDAAMAIHDEEEIELQALRPEIRLKIWRDHEKKLLPMMEETEVECEAIKKRLKAMRDLAMKSKPARSTELMTKIEQLEDKFYFGAEMVPLEQLDNEIRFDSEEQAIPSTDDALVDAEQLPVRYVVEEAEQKVEEATEEAPKKRGRKAKY